MSTRTDPSDSMLHSIAVQSNTRIEVVRHLYEEELERLRRNSRVRTFLAVIALRRLKERLLGTNTHRGVQPSRTRAVTQDPR